MVQSLVSDIQNITLFFYKSVHCIYCSRFIIIRSDMHALHTQPFIISKELHL